MVGDVSGEDVGMGDGRVYWRERVRALECGGWICFENFGRLCTLDAACFFFSLSR